MLDDGSPPEEEEELEEYEESRNGYRPGTTL